MTPPLHAAGGGGTIPVRELRAELAEVLDEVADLREHVVVTRRGRPAAVIVPVDEYDALEETAEILSDSSLMRASQRGRREAAAGRTLSLDTVKAELRTRKKR